MTLEKTLNFHDIVPAPSWAERYLPTFLEFARHRGYSQKKGSQTYEGTVTVRMPEIPFSLETHYLLQFFEQVKQVADRVSFQEEKRFRFLLDQRTYEDVTNVPFRDDGTLMGGAMFHLMALTDYATEWFAPQGYRVASLGTDGSNFDLTLRRT